MPHLNQRENFLEGWTKLERLPVEVLEVILSYLRPMDLVAVAESSPRLKYVVKNSRLWRRLTVTVYLSKFDIHYSLLQLELASEIRELKFGSLMFNAEARDAVTSYDGHVPRVHTLHLRLCMLGSSLGMVLLKRHGQTVRHIELDLRHRCFESPRYNLPFLVFLSQFCNVESVAVRVNANSDVLHLNQFELKLTEIDITLLSVRYDYGIDPDSNPGIPAALLIHQNRHHLQTLRLPPDFNISLCRSVESCEELRTLACNVWTLFSVQHLKNLHTLLVYPPDENVTFEDLRDLMFYARQSRNVFKNLKQLRLVNISDTMLSLQPQRYSRVLFRVIVPLCKSLEVLELQWYVGKILGEDSILKAVLSGISVNLRELRIQGNQIPSEHFRCVLKLCPNLRILEVRGALDKGARVCSKTQKDVKVISAEMRRVLILLQEALPNLTVLFDNDGKVNWCDWNIYSLRQNHTEKSQNQLHSGEKKEYPCTFETSAAISSDGPEKLFLHMKTLEEWVSGNNFDAENIPSWLCATLDSSAWSNQDFAELLTVAPALGLLDYCSRQGLTVTKKGLQWIKALPSGPTDIRALRIRASLVSSHLWELMVPILLRIRKSLRCLELDFRGRPFREVRGVLLILENLPNLAELVLRGCFSDEIPVLDCLHGKVRSLTRLDLRNCSVSGNEEMPAFLESLQKLLLEIRETVRAVALPLMSRLSAAHILRTLSELTNLEEVAVHYSNVQELRPLTALLSLELHSDGIPKRLILSNRVAVALRNISSVLERLQSLTLPYFLMESLSVQEVILDVMPKLCKLHVINLDPPVKLCAEGPECKNIMIQLFPH